MEEHPESAPDWRDGKVGTCGGMLDQKYRDGRGEQENRSKSRVGMIW